jgi:hypothetical protein
MRNKLAARRNKRGGGTDEEEKQKFVMFDNAVIKIQGLNKTPTNAMSYSNLKKYNKAINDLTRLWNDLIRTRIFQKQQEDFKYKMNKLLDELNPGSINPKLNKLKEEVNKHISAHYDLGMAHGSSSYAQVSASSVRVSSPRAPSSPYDTPLFTP